LASAPGQKEADNQIKKKVASFSTPMLSAAPSREPKTKTTSKRNTAKPKEKINHLLNGQGGGGY